MKLIVCDIIGDMYTYTYCTMIGIEERYEADQNSTYISRVNRSLQY